MWVCSVSVYSVRGVGEHTFIVAALVEEEHPRVLRIREQRLRSAKASILVGGDGRAQPVEVPLVIGGHRWDGEARRGRCRRKPCERREAHR